MTGLLSSEWLKLRSVRSTYALLALVALTSLVAAWLAYNGTQAWDALPPGRRARFAAPPMEQVTLPFVEICLAVLGALAMTSEYATGSIRASITAVPRRGRMLAAKVPVVAGVALGTGLVFLFGTFLLSRAIVGGRPMAPGYTTAASAQIGMLLASGLAVSVIAVIGLGLGAALRSTAGSVVAVTTLVFVLPTVAGFLPPPWDGRVRAVLPPELAGQLARPPGVDGVLPPAWALAAMAGYVAAALGAGALVLLRKDV